MSNKYVKFHHFNALLTVRNQKSTLRTPRKYMSHKYM